MTVKQRKELYKQAINQNGLTMQTLVLSEECSELVKACSKLVRKQGNQKANIANLEEEIADVEIMIEQMKLYYGTKRCHIEHIKKEKLDRLEWHLKQEQEPKEQIKPAEEKKTDDKFSRLAEKIKKEMKE